jgi:hypothetical protein
LGAFFFFDPGWADETVGIAVREIARRINNLDKIIFMVSCFKGFGIVKIRIIPV